MVVTQYAVLADKGCHPALADSASKALMYFQPA